MLVLLTRVLLWATIGLIVWYLLLKIIPRKYLTWFGGVIVLILIVASFIDPNDQTIGTIWRLISLPLSPLGATVLLLGFSLSDGVNKVKGQQVAIALAILLLSSTPLVARFLAGNAEQAVQQAYQNRRSICQGVCPAEVPENVTLGRAGAIVVFGEPSDAADLGTVYRTQDEVAYNSNLVPRLIYAANLYQQSGRRPPVIVTAGPRSGDPDSGDKESFIRSVLTSNGVPAESIRIIATGENVRATANNVETYMQNQQLLPARASRQESDDNRVVLVAPAINMARSALTFEQMSIQTIARPTDFYTSEAERSGDVFARLPDILPSVSALEVTSRYWDEFLTSVYYFLRGWLPEFKFGWDPNIEI
ncbi:MAG: YdcF family protein [Cyanobacteria bacterium J06632_22]